MKRYLFLLTQPPYTGCLIQETLDIILTTAAFDQSVSLLFLDQGIFQIKAGQHPKQLSLKNTTAMFDALTLYDVQDIYVESESLQEYGLSLADLSLSAQLLSRSSLGEFIASFDIIFSA